MRILFITLALFACEQNAAGQNAADARITLEPGWVLDGLDSPESVIPDKDGAFLYVSNVNGEGEAKDANGYIARVSLDGEIIERNWATDLDAPKGLALADGVLYVSDIDQLVLIDARSGEVMDRVAVPGADFLNDTAATEGGVLVSDSGSARIYQYKDGAISVLIEDDRLSGVNGLLPAADGLYITTMTAGELLFLANGSTELSVIAGGMPDADGVAQLQDGSFLISSWPGALYHVIPNREPRLLLDTAAAEIYLNDFYLLGDRLFVPNWRPGALRSYRVTY